MIKLAFLESDVGIGGAEINVLNLLKYLDRSQFDPLVICPFEGPLTERIKQMGSKVTIVPKYNSFPTSTFILGKKIFNPIATLYESVISFPSAWKLAKFLKSEKVDILHTNSMSAHFYGAIAARIAGVKCLWHLQDIVDPNLCFGLVEKVLKLTGEKLPDKIVVVSKAVGEVFTGESRFKVAVVYNGTDLQHYNPAISGRRIREEFGISPQETVVGIVGRVVPWKGHRELLQAAKLVQERLPRQRFLIVGAATFGDQNYFEEIKKLSVDLGLEQKVIFTGFRHDVPEAIAAMDICVHASNLPDPCPLVIFDYMAAGKPLVATSGGGIPEIVENGKTGLLVPMNDYKTLAEAMTKLLEKPEERIAMGRAGRERVETFFTIESFVNNMGEQYIQLVHKS